MPAWAEVIAVLGVLLGSGGVAAWLRSRGQNRNEYERELTNKFKELDDAQNRLQDRLELEIESLKKENALLHTRIVELANTLANVIAERDVLKTEVLTLHDRLNAVEYQEGLTS